MKAAHISVIVPIYKVEAYLDGCINSIVNQTYTDVEIILVDDGSPDKCGAICDTWAKRDHRIRVIHKENGGLSDARNVGMAAASGEYIAFVDSDDTLEPTFLEELHTAIVRYHADIAECAMDYVDEQDRLLRHRGAADIPVMEKTEAIRRLVLEDGIYQTVVNKLYRRSVIEGVPFEKGKCHEDDFWTYQIFDRIERLVVIQNPLYHYLQRGTGIMGSAYSLRRLDALEARFRRMEYLQKDPRLALLTRQQLQYDCLFHYQCSLRYLTGAEQEQALQRIREIMKQNPRVPLKEMTSAWKQRIWLELFRIAPGLTARLRNAAGIGQ